VVDDVQYEFTSVQAIRGTERKTIAKWEKDGWALDSRNQGLLRTEMTFRRVKPATLGARIRAAFGRLEPTVQRTLLVSSAAVVLLLVVGIVFLGIRSGGSPSQPTASATEADAAASREPTQPSEPQQPAATSSAVPTIPAADDGTAADEVLTVENNEDLAALLAIKTPGAAEVGEFAAEYRGRTIEFDGNIAYMNNHGGYTTRYDLLIYAGDFSTTTVSGPNFQFRDVNITNDLHLTGPNIPDTIGAGDNLHIVARVVDYNRTSELFFLEPVSTQVR
jgi:hypothetical protein